MRRIIIDIPDSTARGASFGDLLRLWKQLTQLRLNGWEFFQDYMYDVNNVRLTMFHK